MMTEKRFTVHIDWFNYDKDEGEATLKDNGQPLLCSESVGDVRWLKELLNELNDENEQIKQTIKEAYKTERTAIGKSVLKQLLERIQ